MWQYPSVPKNTINCLKGIGRGWFSIDLSLESILQINEKYLVHSEISDKNVQGLGTTGCKGNTASLIIHKSWTSLYLLFDIFTPKIRVLHGLLQGVNSPCSFKFSVMCFNLSLTSDFSGYCFWCGKWWGSLSLIKTGAAFSAWLTVFPSAHTLEFTFCLINGRKSGFHIHENRDLNFPHCIPPLKCWGRLWHN